ncbi:MAG: HAD-IIIC family phosphatase [Lachnospiraceae bacterium]|nr:HAD-IIIC family phosphatase [Lachnospiraceae bacterium]
MKALEYPFDASYVRMKKRGIKRELLAENTQRIHKEIAVLGGSTTAEIIDVLELFLLDAGIEPSFYESEYGQFYEDAVFPNERLDAFAPDLIYIHTSFRNLKNLPVVADDAAAVEAKLAEELTRFQTVWENLREKYHCPVIQNNFELPLLRLLGNQDGVFLQGQTSFVRELNRRFADCVRATDGLYLHDLEYLSARFGLDAFSDPFYWHMYKYCMSFQAIPEFAYSLACVIKSIFGKNKKGLVLDLDNTLWGGVIGDDGVGGIELGQETSMGQVYAEFQGYVKSLKQIGTFLAVDSKNEEENALAGLNAPYSILKPEDFLLIKANWEPKDRNLQEIADSIGVLPESLVFVDDNPAERAIVTEQLPGVLAPAIEKVEHYARTIDHAGYFEVTTLSEDDKKRNEMYRENLQRAASIAKFATYEEYLHSLEMTARIEPFSADYLARIAQLTNKSNQFNMTTRRYTQDDLSALSKEPDVLTLYGSLSDRFGDNGIVSVLMGHEEKAEEKVLHLDLWLMSCRVLKRDMECAMMDALVAACKERGIRGIHGYYFKTEKNGMVKDFFAERGFALLKREENGDSEWFFEIPEEYEKQNRVITVLAK